MTADARAIADMFKTVSLGSPQNAVGFVLWRLTHRFQRKVDAVLRPHDLTHLQFTILTMVAWMGRSGGSATQAELARFGGIHPMQVSKVLKALDQKSMVLRMPVPGNAPAKRVVITSKGLATLRIALPLVIDVQQRLFGNEGRPGGSLLGALVELDRCGNQDAQSGVVDPDAHYSSGRS